MPDVFAAADIGSNTVHLLVARVGRQGLVRLMNNSEWLSLGQIVSHDHRIPDDLVARLSSVLTEYGASAKLKGATGLYVFATEAVRRADNIKEVLKKLKKATGFEIDVVSPEREAQLGLKGALLDSPQPGRFLLAETGGGSVQIALCEGPSIIADTSLPLGTGVLIDQVGLKCPVDATTLKKTEDLIENALQKVVGYENATSMIASGGVARGIWRSLHPDGDRTLHFHEINHLAWATSRIDQATISSRFKVKARRADTLLPGALVYRSLLRHFKIDEFVVSQFGVREGAVLEISQGRIVPCPI